MWHCDMFQDTLPDTCARVDDEEQDFTTNDEDGAERKPPPVASRTIRWLTHRLKSSGPAGGLGTN
jgi:hypothetical protein